MYCRTRTTSVQIKYLFFFVCFRVFFSRRVRKGEIEEVRWKEKEKKSTRFKGKIKERKKTHIALYVIVWSWSPVRRQPIRLKVSPFFFFFLKRKTGKGC